MKKDDKTNWIRFLESESKNFKQLQSLTRNYISKSTLKNLIIHRGKHPKKKTRFANNRSLSELLILQKVDKFLAR